MMFGLFVARIVSGGMTLKHTWIAGIRLALTCLSLTISAPTEKGEPMANNEAIEVITHFDKHIIPCDEYGYRIDGDLMEAHLMAAKALRGAWIPVTERLPDVDGDYLVFAEHRYGKWCDVLGFAKDGKKVDKYDFQNEYENVWYRYDSEWGYVTTNLVTHWMPLPEPPKEE